MFSGSCLSSVWSESSDFVSENSLGSQKDPGALFSAAASLSCRNVQARGTMALALGKLGEALESCNPGLGGAGGHSCVLASLTTCVTSVLTSLNPRLRFC